MKTLFSHADILIRKDNKIDFLRNAFLGIDGAVIDYVGTERPQGIYDTEKNMSGKLLIPGLVNAHTHTSMTLLRGIGSDKPLQEWLFNEIIPVEDKMDGRDVAIGTQFAIMEMLAGGTTCYQDMYWNQAEFAEMLLETGIKVNTGATVQVADSSSQSSIDFCERRIRQTEEFFKQYNNAGDGRIHANLQLHSEYLMTDKYAEILSELVHKYKLEVHAHVSETKKEHDECLKRRNITPLKFMEQMGFLDYGAVCAHCVWATDDDLDIMARKGASLVHNPTSNLKLGSGIAPIAKALKKGVNITIGTDGTASNNNLNMFEEMHIASIIHKGYLLDAVAVSAQEAFDMATYNGYRALHRQDCGSIEIGNRADIVAIDMDKPHLLPDIDTLALLVYSAQASDVCMTMVDGRVLYENGEYLTIDEEKCKAEYMDSVKKLYA